MVSLDANGKGYKTINDIMIKSCNKKGMVCDDNTYNIHNTKKLKNIITIQKWKQGLASLEFEIRVE